MSEKKSVLLVEDDGLIRGFLVNALKDRYNVFEMSDAESALDVIESKKVDLIVLDVLLPGESGFSMLRKIKKHDSRYKDIPVIIISNFDDDKDIKEGIKLGAVEFLVKANNTPAEIAEKIERILQ